ncbi:MAG: arginine--tRNA ligase [Acholeplasmataceae bacterium]|jgi:arginyl-tRNA synthetase|nr:arginine--tRNA ligase [Acholeplasmataceae bacterium]MCK9289439.1 arginine--tRNA ligase [Acholeplasmataceae bacterium]MCK9427846.1 arginine--tRNA ligase [Acholeplasmataceae bacterium]HHT38878.1 arginine--tRNA ligase [Acholeplasmataceae bacterium]
MLLKVKTLIKEKLLKHYQFPVLVEEPKREEADLAIPLFNLARQTEIKITTLAEEIKALLSEEELISEVYFLKGFLNLNLNKKLYAKAVLKEVVTLKEDYGSVKEKKGVVVIDFSSPNIAKNFSVGHLRSTVIGASLARLYQKRGYEVIKINHLGDWGTQFGKMIVAYLKWGDETSLKTNPIDYLQNLYVKFHEESNDSLEEEARFVFKELEKGNKKYLALWQQFKQLSLLSFQEIYELLKVSFDYYHGESFYQDKTAEIVLKLNEKGLTKKDDGALIVDLEKENLGVSLIERSDGATLYMTRDLAALFYRFKTFNFSKILYVVGNEQKLHFKQLEAITRLMGYDFEIIHVNFGLILKDGKKMTTRGGNVVKLKAVIDEAIEIAEAVIEEKNPHLKNKEEVARSVALSAIIFNDLKQDRNLDIEFDLEEMLSFEGLTGPYLQYSSVRMASLLKAQTLTGKIAYELFEDELYFKLIKEVSVFNELLEKSLEADAPYLISRYLLNLAALFNRFYSSHKIIVNEEIVKNTNLTLTFVVRTVLNEGLKLLNMTVLDEM